MCLFWVSAWFARKTSPARAVGCILAFARGLRAQGCDKMFLGSLRERNLGRKGTDLVRLLENSSCPALPHVVAESQSSTWSGMIGNPTAGVGRILARMSNFIVIILIFIASIILKGTVMVRGGVAVMGGAGVISWLQRKRRSNAPAHPSTPDQSLGFGPPTTCTQLLLKSVY